ncbi:MAG: hypothetical protein LQ351_004812 [Letrouitia transgressa]|nr:MAG: hypothetical protein LQ351_004812 [Letrouitia transgressa]
MEPVGLTVGIVGLASLVTLCCDAFKLLEKDEHMGADLGTLALRLDHDHRDLVKWSAKNAIPVDDIKEVWWLRHANQQRIHLAMQSLSHVNYLRWEVEKIKDRYGMRGASPIQIVPISSGLRTRKRLRLLIFDASRLRQLVDDIHAITDDLIQIDLFEGRPRGWRTLARLSGSVRRRRKFLKKALPQ